MNIALSDIVTGEPYGVFPSIGAALGHAERIGVYAVLTIPTDDPVTERGDDMASPRRERQRANRLADRDPKDGLLTIQEMTDTRRLAEPKPLRLRDLWARLVLHRFG